jgi:hypothetical protein
MPIQVPIDAVLRPRFLQVRGSLLSPFPNPDVPDQLQDFPVTMEVYSGVVAFNFFGVVGSIRRDQYRTFLPFAPNELRSYPRGSLLDVAATASPAVIAHDEDNAVLYGVDEVASVRLETQAFDPTDPIQVDFCLVMRVELAAMNVEIIRFTYKVTLLISEGENPREIGPLPDGTLPR